MKKAIVAALVALIALGAWSQSPETLNVGYIDSNAAGVAGKNKDFLDWLATKMTSAGVTKVGLVVAANIKEMTDLINQGKVDILIETAYPTYLIKANAPITPTLNRWKKGEGEYKTLIIAKKDSSLAKLADLVGKKVAFESPESTSGRWLPQSALTRIGIKVADVTGGKAVPSGTVGYAFTGDPDETVAWVSGGKAEAGAVSSADWAKVEDDVKAGLKVVAETQSLPRQLVSFRAKLDPKVIKLATDAMAGMDKDPTAKSVLPKWEKVTKVEVLSASALAALAEEEKLIKASGK
jgi:phosphonate transport system substrate-binding protein